MQTKIIKIQGVRNLIIPDIKNQKKISDNPPHYSVLKKRIKEVQKDMSALQHILKNVHCNSIVDALGGCGFSGALLSFLFPKAQLIFNDLDPICCKILQLNFPSNIVENQNILNWDFPSADLIWIDFNNFTLNRLDIWKSVFDHTYTKCKYLLFTDSACYGFSLGNLEKCYGVQNPIEYYQLLNKQLAYTGKTIKKVMIFGGAALVLMEQGIHSIELKKCTTLIPITIVSHEGLFAE